MIQTPLPLTVRFGPVFLRWTGSLRGTRDGRRAPPLLFISFSRRLLVGSLVIRYPLSAVWLGALIKCCFERLMCVRTCFWHVYLPLKAQGSLQQTEELTAPFHQYEYEQP